MHAPSAAAFAVLVAMLTTSTAMAIEEPGYQVLEKDGSFESVACWRYSGRWTAANYRHNATLLRERIKARGLVVRGGVRAG